MAYDHALADRVRDELAGAAGVTEKAMFGGIAFLLRGNMTGRPMKGWILVRPRRRRVLGSARRLGG
jgi:TfoX/Sxy family transcriptional regulator of competence genes